jgi:hypothetical protein
MLHVRGGALRKQTHDGGPIEFLAFSLAHFIRGGLPSLMHADRAKYLPTFHLFPPGLERLRICIIFIWSFTAAGPPRGGAERRRVLSPSPPLSSSISLSLSRARARACPPLPSPAHPAPSRPPFLPFFFFFCSAEAFLSATSGKTV